MMYGIDMELREYQTFAINQVRNQFKSGKKKVLIVSPTGSGKTLIASEIIRQSKEKGKSVLFVCHRRELVMQSVNKLFDYGITSGTIMAGKEGSWLEQVQVASIQTFISRKDKEEFIKPDADLIIIDEAHRSTSESYKKLIAEYPKAFLIGLTATPCRSDNQPLGNIYEELIEVSTINDLTKQGFLVPTKTFAPTIPDLKGVRIMAGDYDKKELDKRMNTTKLVGDLVEHYKLFGENRPTIVFASSIAHSRYICKIFNQNGIPSGHIDSETPEIERERQLALLDQNKIKVLSNCMILTEGWDQPKVSCLILARPTKSLGLYLQMIGRTLRPYPEKKETLIFDHSGSVYEFGDIYSLPSWELIMAKEKEKKKKEIKPLNKQDFTCIKCDHIYKPTKENPECPNCSHKPDFKKEVKLLIKEGRLKELERPKETKAVDKKKFYAQLLFVAKQKGYKEGWASHCFRKKFEHFPHSKQVLPMQPEKDVLGFIKHLQIKQAKSKNFRRII